MTAGKLSLAFLWHQHQPYYRNMLTGDIPLPWVRLHGVREYIGMALLLERYPAIKATINLVPCLVKQISELAEGQAEDLYMTLSRIPPADLSEEDRIFIIKNFFHMNHQTMVAPFPRFHELLLKRSSLVGDSKTLLKVFRDEDILDLVVWFNLSWIHPLLRESDEGLKWLVAKGRGFTLDERDYVLKRHIEFLADVIPLHRKLVERGQVELSTSPFYHPILPLLCNMQSAREALPDIVLPSSHDKKLYEDARRQIEAAVQFHTRTFGIPPKGMWPPEGSVSTEVLPLFARAGIKWLATDEQILERSLNVSLTRDQYGHLVAPEKLCQPYAIGTGNDRLVILFRDLLLSDRISFVYHRNDHSWAVDDLIHRLQTIKANLSKTRTSLDGTILTIILDGENPWEHYSNAGLDFLSRLYERLSNHDDIVTTRIGEFVETHPPTKTLDRIFAGSWISHNFAIWVGHEEDNKGWDYIAAARQALVDATTSSTRPSEEKLNKAWESLLAAEGSDWFWWFGEDHSSAHNEEFDTIFRTHLQNVYTFIGSEPPSFLFEPIIDLSKQGSLLQPGALLDVKLDGKCTGYFEWLRAGRFRPDRDTITMQRAVRNTISELFYGFNKEDFFLRLDTAIPINEAFPEGTSIRVNFIRPREIFLIVKDLKTHRPRLNVQHRDPASCYLLDTVAIDDFIEMSCPFLVLGFCEDEEATFFVEIEHQGAFIERYPAQSVIRFRVPSKNFEEMQWLV